MMTKAPVILKRVTGFYRETPRNDYAASIFFTVRM